MTGPATTTAEDSIEGVVGPDRRKMPDDREGVTHKFRIIAAEGGEHEGYITANTYEDGRLGEVAGEAGEIANKVKKIMRDDNGMVREERIEAIKGEVGGTLWYLANLCEEMGCSLEDVARANLVQLAERRERGALHGEGDGR